MALLPTVQHEVLERLGRVAVAARHAVESLLAGQHPSIHRGLSVEFAGHRPYQPGDDLRHLDWTVWARTDRLDVKVYEEETRLRAAVVVDYSGSMAYGSLARSKLDYARILAAVLGVLMVRQGDAVGLACCDTVVREFVPPAASMAHLLGLLERLEANTAGGETDLAGVLDDLAERLRRRGLVILISDCIAEPQRLIEALKHLRHRRQDVRVFQLLDPAEEEFPFAGTVEFAGLEHEARRKLDADRIRRRYREALDAHRRTLAAGCHAAGIALHPCRTDEDPALVLVRALGQQGSGERGRR